MKNEHQEKASRIIKKCLRQNKIFQKLRSEKHWQTIHTSHYDWWAFPINERSGYGEQYMVREPQIVIMKAQKQFMQALQSNAIIVCLAWGYDLTSGEQVKTQDKNQSWHKWPIRLYKMTKSLEIFGHTKLFQNAVKYGILLMKRGQRFTYNSRNIAPYFQAKNSQIYSNFNKNRKKSIVDPQINVPTQQKNQNQSSIKKPKHQCKLT